MTIERFSRRIKLLPGIATPIERIRRIRAIQSIRAIGPLGWTGEINPALRMTTNQLPLRLAEAKSYGNNEGDGGVELPRVGLDPHCSARMIVDSQGKDPRWNMAFFFYLVGMVLIIEGLPYLTFPLFMQHLLKKIPELPANHLRIYGFLLMIIGLGVIALTRFWPE
jgi:uncharacterized protein